MSFTRLGQFWPEFFDIVVDSCSESIVDHPAVCSYLASGTSGNIQSQKHCVRPPRAMLVVT